MTQPPDNEPVQPRPRHPLEAPDPHELEAAAMRAARERGDILPIEYVQAPRHPYLTYVLLGINTLIFVAGMASATLYVQLLLGGWLDPYGIINRGEWWRLLTLMFLHGSLQHLIMNNLALYTIGSRVETTFGHARFLLIYFLGGLLGSILQLLFGGNNPAVGASGALFAVVGAEMVHLHQHRTVYMMAQRRQQNLILVAGLNLAVGFLYPDLIGNWGHIGGFIGGVLLAWRIGPRYSLNRTRLPAQPASVPAIDTNPLRRQHIPVIGAFVVGLILLGGLTLLLLHPQPFDFVTQ